MTKLPIIKISDVHKSFGEAKVLNGISMDIFPGNVVCIIGPSGTGKSTLLRCINALVPVDQGSILVEGQEVHDKHVDLATLHRRVGMVFQQFNLFPHRTVLDNISLAPIHVLKEKRADAEDRARYLLDKVQLAGCENKYPLQLSGGQQQRVAIARSLAMQPKIMLFDEITASLDPEMVKSIQKIIHDLALDGMTCVVATHEMDFAEKISDDVYFMEHGVIVEHGSPSQIFVNPLTSRMKAFLGYM